MNEQASATRNLRRVVDFLKYALIALLIAAFLWNVYINTLVAFDVSWELWEDGSFRLSGCIPTAICN